MEYPGIDGFLGTRASIMLDVVVVAMLAILPVLAWSIWAARRKRYVRHKQVQLTLGALLAVTVLLFEIDIRFVSGWRERAMPSPYYGPMEQPPAVLRALYTAMGVEQVPGWLATVLAVHLVFAVSTALLWVYVLAEALWRFPRPPRASPHSPRHRFWGRLAALDMLLTALTGWLFYWLAFVA